MISDAVCVRLTCGQRTHSHQREDGEICRHGRQHQKNGAKNDAAPPQGERQREDTSSCVVMLVGKHATVGKYAVYEIYSIESGKNAPRLGGTEGGRFASVFYR